jgi:hypothetical protein
MIAQNEEVLHRRATAVVTIAAGVTSLASLIVGLSGGVDMGMVPVRRHLQGPTRPTL